MPDTQKAIKKIEKVLMGYFLEDPILLSTYTLIDKEADPNQETIGLDIRGSVPKLKFNPNFINALSEQQLDFVLTSEGFKVLLRHCTTRLLEPRQISSISSSITVNEMLKNNSNFREMNFDFILKPESFDLKPDKYFEEYFRQLLEKSKDAAETIQKIWNSLSQEEKEKLMGQGSLQGGDQENQKSEQGKGESEKEDNSNENSDGGYKEFKNGDEAFKEYFNPNGTSNQHWGKNEMFDHSIQQMVEEKKNQSREWGKYTQNFMGEIVAANEPKISYKEIIRRFNRSVVSTASISSRMKVNRRYDLLQPGYRRQYKSKILFAVDVSGSMSDEDLKEGFAVINSICKHSSIEYLLFDTEIKQIEKNFKKAKKTFKICGRGGTDCQCVFDYAEKQKVDGVVVYTDMAFLAPKEPRKCKVLWLSTSKDFNPPVNWGYKAHLNRLEMHY